MTARVTVGRAADLRALAGTELGVSDWMEARQEDIDLFAKATGDHQWIHTDPERARAESPHGGTIAHGYFTLSLAPRLRAEILEVRSARKTINYGLNRLRFPAPLKTGSRVRMRARLESVEDVPGGAQTVWALVFEAEGQDKPVCVAEAIYRYLE